MSRPDEVVRALFPDAPVPDAPVTAAELRARVDRSAHRRSCNSGPHLAHPPHYTELTMQYEPSRETQSPAYPVPPSVDTQYAHSGHLPTSPAAGYPHMYGPPPQRPRKVWPYLAAAGVAVMFVGVGWFVYDEFVRTDSGIAACEAMAADKKVGNGTADGTFTEQEYRDARAIFTDSRHADIRAAGVKMVDLLWQVEQVDTDNDLAAALLYGQRATDAMGEMTTACANHGIVVKFAD